MSRKPENMSWESFAEHLIQQAQSRGEFDNLPGFGKPIPGLDENPLDENWWIKEKLRRENLSVLPASLRIRVDVQQTMSRVWELSREEDVLLCIRSLNQRIAEANRSLEPPPSTTPLVDEAEVLERWRALRNQE